ncbi:hypothetical protein CC85DRAFT_164731 [Cutaneotrichosporon oleaginosum]|uniref:Uncharacterized protein n=1 Tax=Cutaneotrichosporon oleaginosum TaxID=879819 RepID=A0A0J0XG13_9TREE|nr:uncharacterized protein CC85DRAFT_164731 [Cutaneotrichosporon oleaginosum]KLT40005.1 hypothetical protein CC85DRAFT_164731 [Cutaneotrichosporon oleaginosum]TXT13852.1 hypothetical protein COLE_00045 [Cutaneotrichosporon oleaginosum]
MTGGWITGDWRRGECLYACLLSGTARFAVAVAGSWPISDSVWPSSGQRSAAVRLPVTLSHSQSLSVAAIAPSRHRASRMVRLIVIYGSAGTGRSLGSGFWVLASGYWTYHVCWFDHLESFIVK